MIPYEPQLKDKVPEDQAELGILPTRSAALKAQEKFGELAEISIAAQENVEKN